MTSTSCAASFAPGRIYLAFARSSNGRLTTSQCSGSRPVSQAETDLAYLREWQKGRTPTRIVGSIFSSEFTRDLPGRALSTWRQTAPLNADGSFSIPVPLPGAYRASLISPGWISQHPAQEVTVPALGCAEAYFPATPNGRISGTALAADGALAPNVLLKLLPTEFISETPQTTTGPDGRFEFTGLPPGEYRLGVNPERMDDPTPKVPYAPAFYPGTPAEDQSTLIRVPLSGHVVLPHPFRLPPRSRPRPLRITVLTRARQPFNGVHISCVPEGRHYWKTELTDRNGQFTCPAMDRIAYIVDVSLSNDDPRIPPGQPRARWVRVPAGAEPAEIRLTLP